MGTNLYKVDFTFTTEMLGTAPNNPQVYTDFIASKKLEKEKELATTPEAKAVVAEKQKALDEEEVALLHPDDQKGLTIFRQSEDPKGLILLDYMVRGFLKSGAAAIGAPKINKKTNATEVSSWGWASKIDRFVFVTDKDKKPVRKLFLLRDGKPILEPDAVFQRPLRANTMQGPRVSLASSEQVDAGATMSCHLYVLPLGTKDITKDTLVAWLGYGIYCGIGQFRTGSYGRFDATLTEI